MRAATYVLSLAWKRVRRRSSGALLAAAGIAVGTAVLFGILAGTKVAQDRSASQAVERVTAAARSLRVAWFGVPSGASERLPALDEAVRGELADVGLAGPSSLVLFRESTVAGRFAGLAAVDGLAPHVVLRSGRLPRRCTPARCEVLRLRGEGADPERPRSPTRRGGHGNAPLQRPLRGLSLTDRQRARRPRGCAGAAERVGLPPTRPGAAARGGRRRCARCLTGARRHLPQLRVGVAASIRCSPYVGNRRIRAPGRAGRRRARRDVVVLRGAGARRGAPGGRAGEHGGGAAPAARGRGSGRASVCLRGAGRPQHAARSRGCAPAPHVVRRTAMAASTAVGRRERVRCGGRRPGRLARRSRGGRPRGAPGRGSRERRCSARACSRRRRSRSQPGWRSPQRS